MVIINHLFLHNYDMHTVQIFYCLPFSLQYFDYKLINYLLLKNIFQFFSNSQLHNKKPIFLYIFLSLIISQYFPTVDSTKKISVLLFRQTHLVRSRRKSNVRLFSSQQCIIQQLISSQQKCLLVNMVFNCKNKIISTFNPQNILDAGEKIPLEKGLNKIGVFFFFGQHILTSVQIDLSYQQFQTKLSFVSNTFINFFNSKFKIDFFTVLQLSIIFMNFF
eukprot:TRINITY_DN569_c0_g1_i5.p2 TRINITY_DN569_c0_g1~~TRINITY_DN569_c0_g1_i5.p2  ORF type:complete len:219 (-),score=-15.70 TRINITY_DN569_c0_g1_i5:365-1021(-)